MRYTRATIPAPIVALFVAMGCLVSPCTAESVPAPQALPAAPASSQMTLPARTQSALKLAGLVTFVANSCPRLEPNYARFIEAIEALGLTKTDLEKADLKAGYLGYAARYNADVRSSCERASTQFGPKGTTLSGVFSLR